MSDPSRGAGELAATDGPSPPERALSSEDDLVAEGLLALRDEGPSDASKRHVLEALGLGAGPRASSRARVRAPLGVVTQGLAVGFALGLVLVIFRVMFR
jgi:hypothetical protein